MDHILGLEDSKSYRIVLRRLDCLLVNSVAFSPDGKCLASGSNEKTIRIWDAETGVLTSGLLEGHVHWVESVVFSPDGKRVASGSSDNTIRIWNAQTGILVFYSGHSRATPAG